MASKLALLLSVSMLLSLSLTTLSDDCVYTIYVRTGAIDKAGTDSMISVQMSTAEGDSVFIKDLEKWGGLMGSGHEYFERGNLDNFSGRGPCWSGPMSSMILSSDGMGEGPSWYIDYLTITTAADDKPCNYMEFEVYQWLALDEPPHELTVAKNNCPKSNSTVGSAQFGVVI